MDLCVIDEVESALEYDCECGCLEDDRGSWFVDSRKKIEDVKKDQVVDCLASLKKCTKIMVALYFIIKIVAHKPLLSTLARILPQAQQIIAKSRSIIFSFILSLYYTITKINSRH